MLKTHKVSKVDIFEKFFSVCSVSDTQALTVAK